MAMHLDDLARMHLELPDGADIGGIGHANLVKAARLDVTLESLKRVDELLDQIHETGVNLDAFVAEKPNQNPLSVLGFSMSAVIEREAGMPVALVTPDVLIAENPELEEQIPDCFEASVLGMFAGIVFLPLDTIVERGFNGLSIRASGGRRKVTSTTRGKRCSGRGSGSRCS